MTFSEIIDVNAYLSSGKIKYRGEADIPMNTFRPHEAFLFYVVMTLCPVI